SRSGSRHARSAASRIGVGALPSQEGRRGRCNYAPGAPDSHVSVQRARSAGAARARAGQIRHPAVVMTALIRRFLSTRVVAVLLLVALSANAARAQRLLVPMDDAQQNHLKAYGLTYNAIKAGASAEWLLNYRGGSFLLADTPEIRRQAGLAGITIEPVDNGKLGSIRAEIASSNMEAVPLEKAPKIAVYRPPDELPWDDAVTLALNYAGIEYTSIYDDEVERGDLSKYDWLHLHHEDFTGQLNKFYLSYRDVPWFIDLLQKNTATAKRLGFSNMPALKKDVAEKIREFVERGGFLFAM